MRIHLFDKTIDFEFNKLSDSVEALVSFIGAECSIENCGLDFTVEPHEQHTLQRANVNLTKSELLIL